MMKKFFKNFVIPLACLFIGSVCYSDFRYYAWTYQFITMLPGKAELGPSYMYKMW